MALDFLTGKRSLWIVVLATPGMLLSGQKPSVPPPDEDPFVGQWKASVTKSRPKLGEEEGSYETTIKREGDYLVYSSSQRKSPRAFGPPIQKWQYKLLCDGRPRSLPTHLSTSCVYVAPNRVEGETDTLNTNQPTIFWTREVSADGQETTVFNYEDKKRTRLRSIQVLDRVK